MPYLVPVRACTEACPLGYEVLHELGLVRRGDEDQSPHPLGCYDFLRTRTLNTTHEENGTQREASIAIHHQGYWPALGLSLVKKQKNRGSAE